MLRAAALSCHHMSSYIWPESLEISISNIRLPPLTSKQNKKPNDLGSPRPLGYLASVPRFIFTTDQRGTEIPDGNVATRHFALTLLQHLSLWKNSDKSNWSACNIKELNLVAALPESLFRHETAALNGRRFTYELHTRVMQMIFHPFNDLQPIAAEPSLEMRSALLIYLRLVILGHAKDAPTYFLL